MFKKSGKKPITLRIGEAQLSFASTNELEFALNGRVGLPSSRFKSLTSAPTDALQKEAEGIRQMERKLTAAITAAMENENAVGEFFKELDLSAVSQDNDWRAIINALYGLDSSSNEYRKIGLIKYSQYLAARREVVQSLYSMRQEEPADAPPVPATEVFKETVLFDLTGLVAASKNKGHFGRLPKGETVDIALATNQSVTVILAKHRFSILRNDKFRFIDDSGRDIALRRGKNIVGRDHSSDVVVGAEYRDVSRKHLIVETEGPEVIRLTDISSLGTSIPHEYLDATAP